MGHAGPALISSAHFIECLTLQVWRAMDPELSHFATFDTFYPVLAGRANRYVVGEVAHTSPHSPSQQHGRRLGWLCGW